MDRHDRQQHEGQEPGSRLGHGSTSAAHRSDTGAELVLPNEEVITIDVAVFVGVTVHVHGATARELAKAGLPDQEVITIDITVDVEVGIEKRIDDEGHEIGVVQFHNGSLSQRISMAQIRCGFGRQ